MKKLDLLPDREYILGNLFIVANKLEKIIDRDLKQFDITSKQWILSAVIDTLFEGPPTINEVAKEMGSSHQNIKQVALKLQSKGLLTLEKDKSDGRVTRLAMNDKSQEFWKSTHDKGNAFTDTMFDGVKSEELENFRNTLKQILSNLEKMEKEQD